MKSEIWVKQDENESWRVSLEQYRRSERLKKWGGVGWGGGCCSCCCSSGPHQNPKREQIEGGIGCTEPHFRTLFQEPENGCQWVYSSFVVQKVQVRVDT